jgi:glycosyltransferase involved in cell wall biosynthesis
VNILFISRSTLFSSAGGDTVQVMKTAEYLRLAGFRVDVRLCTDTIDYAPYDLIHFFNIIRPADILQHIFDSGKPYVVSTIYVDYAEYEARARTGWTRLLFRLFSSDQVEYLKVVARKWKNGEKIVSPRYLIWGHRRSIRYIIRHARCLLPNSNSEYRRLAAHYKLQQTYRAIPNAIDPSMFRLPADDRDRDACLVLCVGRIEGRKGQLALIRALRNTKYTLYIIGSSSPNQQEYYRQCLQEAGDNVRFIEAIRQEELVAYYAAAKVHVLPSWFETTGLSSLEAAAMGCNIVITDKGDTREYFGDLAWYCEPDSPSSILAAVEAAAAAGRGEALVRKIRTEYTWEAAAAGTAAAYRSLDLFDRGEKLSVKPDDKDQVKPGK